MCGNESRTSSTNSLEKKGLIVSQPAVPLSPSGGASCAKIRAAHLEKLAIVYVRQSSPTQVLEHRESTARQYGFADQAVRLRLAA